MCRPTHFLIGVPIQPLRLNKCSSTFKLRCLSQGVTFKASLLLSKGSVKNFTTGSVLTLSHQKGFRSPISNGGPTLILFVSLGDLFFWKPDKCCLTHLFIIYVSTRGKKESYKRRNPQGMGASNRAVFENGNNQTMSATLPGKGEQQRSSLEWYALLTLFMLLF